MSKDVSSLFDSEARALEREARAAKADIEQLVQALAALPADMRATIHDRIDSQRSRLEAITAQAEQALDDQRVDLAAKLARLDGQLEGRVDELQRRRIEALKAEAEAAYEDSRYALERARIQSKSGVEVALKSVRVSESSLSQSS